MPDPNYLLYLPVIDDNKNNNKHYGIKKHRKQKQKHKRKNSENDKNNKCLSIINSLMPAGSIQASVFTVVISTVGAGSLSLPFAVATIGLIPGIIVLISSAFLAYFTLDLLLISVDYLPSKSKISYRCLAIHSYGNGLAYLIQITLLLQFYGSAVSYIVAFGNLLNLVWNVYVPNTSIYVYSAVGVVTLFVIPLSLFRSMAKLRFTSLLGISCSMYLSIVLFIEYFVLCNQSYGCFWQTSSNNIHSMPELENAHSIPNFIANFLTAFPLNVFAFTCHPYILPCYVELRNRNKMRMRKVLSSAVGITFAIYALVSLSGFLLFLNKTCGDILINNFNQHIDIMFAAIGIACSCILTLPIYAFTFRSSFGTLIWGTKQLATKKHVVVTVTFIALSLFVAISVTSISVVFGILGCTTYPMLGYILPAVFFCKLVPYNDNNGKYKMKRRFAIIQACFVGCASIASLTIKIYDIIQNINDQKKNCN